MEFLWGGMLVILIVAVLWASRDRGVKVEEKELDDRKADTESWTLDSAEESGDSESGDGGAVM